MSEVQIKAQRDLSIAGDVVGRDKITINITRGLDELPTRYDSRVQNFLEYYLGAKDHPAPFGGRASDLAALDTWLDDPAAAPYASLIAPAGRGKSALLAHWVMRLVSSNKSGEAIHVVYFPISIRFNTNLETVVFASLAARISHVFGEKVTYTPDTNQYRGVFSDYLRRTPPNGSRVLVVLDGLDEAAGWEASADLFPTVAPGHLRVLVAARPLALDKDETAWLNRLGWEMPNRAQRLSLAGLDREGVRDVLSQMGNPLDALATKIDLISRLYELSAGDPLLVRLYVEALLPQGAQAATLTPDDLAKLQPGLEAYFKRWFEEQQKLWGAAKPLQDKTVRGLLNLCAAALGPLKKDDVLALAPDIFEDSGLLDEAAQAVNRFIIGDGFNRGYVFSHPRLAEYFAAKLTERERQAWQARFLQYGRDTHTALENKTLLPKNAPAYVVQYYAAHLAQANAPATDFYALICEGWLRAWEWLEGTPAGFLNDVERAWQKAEIEGPAALGQQIRAALCFASVASLSANISNDLLVACVRAGAISPALGLVMARQKPDPQERAECLAAIAEVHSSESLVIMREALSAACDISEEKSRGGVLGALLLQLPHCEQAAVLVEKFNATNRISFNDESPSGISGRLKQRLSVNQIDEAWKMARDEADENHRAAILKELTTQLPEELLEEALSIARKISDNIYRAEILGKIAPRLPANLQTAVWKEALVTALAIPEETFRTNVLCGFAPSLPEFVFNEAFPAVLTISNKMERAYALGALAPRLPKKLLYEAFSALCAISDEDSRALFLSELGSKLPHPDQEIVFAKALNLARKLSNTMSRALVLGRITSRLPACDQAQALEEALTEANCIVNKIARVHLLLSIAKGLSADNQRRILEEALTVALEISREQSRVLVLKDLVSHLPESLLRQAISAIYTFSNAVYRADVLEHLSQYLPDYMLGEALSIARTISDRRARTKVLGKIALRLPEHNRQEVLVEALSEVHVIADKGHRAEIFKIFAPHLPKNLLMVASATVCTISDEEPLGKFWEELTRILPDDILEEVLLALQAISDEEMRSFLLRLLVPRLSGKLIWQALSVACNIVHEKSRAHALRELAPRLPIGLIEKAESSARTLSNQEYRALVLGALAPRLLEDERAKMFEEALSAVCDISNKQTGANVLKELVPSLPENLLVQALQIVKTLSHNSESIAVLSNLAPRWSAVCRSTQRSEFEELSAMLRAFARTQRPQFLQAIQALLPVIAEQGGTPALRETARAIVDTANWWP